MRISDWSSDVCSSDLQPARDVGGHQFARIFVLKLVDAAFAAAVTERFPFGPRHRPERLCLPEWRGRSEEHTSELQSLMRISYAVFCLKKQIKKRNNETL